MLFTGWCLQDVWWTNRLLIGWCCSYNWIYEISWDWLFVATLIACDLYKYFIGDKSSCSWACTNNNMYFFQCRANNFAGWPNVYYIILMFVISILLLLIFFRVLYYILLTVAIPNFLFSVWKVISVPVLPCWCAFWLHFWVSLFFHIFIFLRHSHRFLTWQCTMDRIPTWVPILRSCFNRWPLCQMKKSQQYIHNITKTQ